MNEAPRVGTPAERMRGRCSCGAVAVIRFEGDWCPLCALFVIGDGPVVAYYVLIDEPLPKRGLALRMKKVAA